MKSLASITMLTESTQLASKGMLMMSLSLCGLFLKHLKSASTNRLEPYGGGEPSLIFLRPREKARLVNT